MKQQKVGNVIIVSKNKEKKPEQWQKEFPDPDSCIDFTIESLRKMNYFMSEHSLETYRVSIGTCIKRLKREQLPMMPWLIDEDTVSSFIGYMIADGLSVSTMKMYSTCLRKYCEAFDNYSASRPFTWPQYVRSSRVRWLEVYQVEQLLDSLETPLERAIIHCELYLGMRRVEATRLLIYDIDNENGTILVRGKGHRGGKQRLLPCQKGDCVIDNTADVFNQYYEYRNLLISSIKLLNPEVKVPDNVFIYAKGNKLYPYSEKGSGIDEIMKKVAIRSGIEFSNHDLRRTFARTIWIEGGK